MKKNKKNISLEESFKELEEIMIKIDASDITLEEMIDYYKMGINLIKYSQEKLSKAEREFLKSRLPDPRSIKGNRMMKEALVMPPDLFKEDSGVVRIAQGESCPIDGRANAVAQPVRVKATHNVNSKLKE